MSLSATASATDNVNSAVDGPFFFFFLPAAVCKIIRSYRTYVGATVTAVNYSKIE